MIFPGSGVIVRLEGGDFTSISVMDLIILLNELRMAGAEAISINDQRIIHNSYVAYINNRHISVNGRRIVEPFTVKAIGNPTHLEAGLSQRRIGYIDTMAFEGKSVTVTREDNITIYRYDGELQFEYVR